MAFIRNLSIKWKLRFTIMAVCMTAIIVSGVLFFAYEYQSIQRLLERDLATLAKVSARNSTAALSFEDPTAAEDTLAALSGRPSIEAACLYDKNNEVFATYFRNGEKRAIPQRPKADGYEQAHDHAALFAPVTFKDERIGTIYVQADLTQLYEWVKACALASGVIVFSSLAFAFVVSTFMQRPFLAPIMGLSETARQVSSRQDYALRARKYGEDELGSLIDGFNDMLAQIQARDSALAQSRQELEQRVEVRTRDLQEANKELEAFSYSVAHDLRAPLRSIDGFSQVLSEDYEAKLDATGRDYIRRIRAATQRMGHLLDDMLNLSRVTRSTLNPTSVDIADIGRTIISELRRANPGREVEFIAPQKMVVSGDSGLLRILLDNLLGNAWKFTGKKTHAKLELGMQQQDGKPVYFVRDNGAGFDMAFSGRLFGVFHRLHTVAEFPGTGVGLATVQRIVSKHGGRIWAEAEVDKGATFFFTLSLEAEK